MNIYLVTQKERDDYDTYSGFVIIALDEEAARNTHPAGYRATKDGKFIEDGKYDYEEWASSTANVTVEFIGEAKGNSAERIVLTSFHAG